MNRDEKIVHFFYWLVGYTKEGTEIDPHHIPLLLERIRETKEAQEK